MSPPACRPTANGPVGYVVTDACHILHGFSAALLLTRGARNRVLNTSGTGGGEHFVDQALNFREELLSDTAKLLNVRRGSSSGRPYGGRLSLCDTLHRRGQ